MLVLTRKTEQKIHIGPDIIITVLKIEGGQVSIGIDAPINLEIVREELILSESIAKQSISFKNDN